MDTEVRVLTRDDAGALFALRQAALVDAPLAFLSSPDDDLADSAAAMGARLSQDDGAVVFGAGPERLLGMAGVHPDRHLKARHKAHIWGMYVRPEARGRGVGKALLAAAVAHARGLDGVRWAHLGVSETAGDARRLYEAAGFVAWGTEPDALCHEGQCVREFHMALAL